MKLGGIQLLPGLPDRDRVRLELQVLLLQSTMAAFAAAGISLGWFGTDSTASKGGACWIAGYHLLHGWYVLRRRIPGRPYRLVEAATPLLDISCITTAWVVLGQAESPFWAVYLYALVGYGRRYHGRKYFLLTGFIVVNIVAGRVAISGGPGRGTFVDANLLTMVLLAGAVAFLSHAVGTAWRQAERRARQLAETDPLTGIANRRVFLERLEAAAAEPGHGFALLMLDLDDFKRLNDEHGHLHGDDVLANVAGILTESIREGDELARYGGEEFIIAMPGTSLADAAAVAEQLRAAIFEATPTSVSVGCAVRGPGERVEAVLRRADELLLAAKRTGKNAVRSGALRRSA